MKKTKSWKIVALLPYAPWDTWNLRPSLWVFEHEKEGIKEANLHSYWDDGYGWGRKSPILPTPFERNHHG